LEVFSFSLNLHEEVSRGSDIVHVDGGLSSSTFFYVDLIFIIKSLTTGNKHDMIWNRSSTYYVWLP